VYKTARLFKADKHEEKEEKDKLTLQKILDIQRKRKRSIASVVPIFGSHNENENGEK
jgi:hypothetical protein